MRYFMGTAAVLIALTNPVGAREPVSTLAQLGPALTRCWSAPGDASGHEITLRFSLRRDGTLIGEPRITYSRLPGDDATARRFVASVLASLAECLPVKLADGLGSAIAGRPLTIRYIAGGAPDLRRG